MRTGAGTPGVQAQIAEADEPFSKLLALASRLRNRADRGGTIRGESGRLVDGITGASVHTLRHTFGTHSAKKGTSLKVRQEALGHVSLKTTTIYVGLAREAIDKELQEKRAIPVR